MTEFSQASRYLMQVEQQNGIPAVKVLSDFFRLAKEWDGADSGVSAKEMCALRREERCFGSRDENGDSLELATSFHRRMLIGVGTVEHSKLPKDFVLFVASLPAHQIADMACGVACESGRLLEIQELLVHDEEDQKLDGSETHLLEEEGERILGDIFGTVFSHVLRAYSLEAIADFFEEDCVQLQKRCEAGRKFVVSE